VTGEVYCEKCNDELVVAETGCLAGNGTPAPGRGWWRRLREDRRRRLAAR